MATNPFQWLGLKSDQTNPDHFQLLGVSRTVENESEFQQAVQQAARRKLAMLTKPELASHSDTIEKLKKRIGIAVKILSDAEKRNQYFQQLKNLGNQSNTSAKNVGGTPVASNLRSPSAEKKPVTEQEIPLAIPIRAPDLNDAPNPPSSSRPPRFKLSPEAKTPSPLPPDKFDVLPRPSDQELEVGIELPQLEKKSFAGKYRRKRGSPWLMIALSLLVVVSVCGLAIVALTLGKNSGSNAIVPDPTNQLSPENWSRIEEVNPPADVPEDDLPNDGREPPKRDGVEENPYMGASLDGSNQSDEPAPNTEAFADRVPIDQSKPDTESAEPVPTIEQWSAEQFALEKQFRALQFGLRNYGEESHLRWEDSECARLLNQLQIQIERASTNAAIAQDSAKLTQESTEAYRDAFSNLRGFWRQFEVGMQALRGGSEIKVNGLPTVFVEYRDGNLVVRTDGYSLRYSRRFIPPDLAVAIAESGRIEDVPTYRFYLATFLALQPNAGRGYQDRINELIRQSVADGHSDKNFRRFWEKMKSPAGASVTPNALSEGACEKLKNQFIQRLSRSDQNTTTPISAAELWESIDGSGSQLAGLELAQMAIEIIEVAHESVKKRDAVLFVEAVRELNCLVEMDWEKMILEGLLKIASEKLDLIQTLILKETIAEIPEIAKTDADNGILVERLQDRLRILESEHQIKGMGQIVGALR
jgi:hypothetical protein